MSAVELSLLARQYVENGWALVPIEDGTKGPKARGWNKRENCVTTLAQCGKIRANVGLAHVYSRTCVLDFDDLALATAWLAEKGIALADLWDSADAVRIRSGRENRGKLLYRLPGGIDALPTYQRPEDGLELRCASSTGLTMQDVLPPSIHPDTGKPYEWDYDEMLGDWRTPPVLPPAVLALWNSLGEQRVAESKLRDQKEPLGLDRSEVRKLLSQISPDCGYQEWVNAGFAVHHEMRGSELGLELWDEWSSEGVDYPGEYALARKWDSFGQNHNGPQVTARSLMAQVGIADIDDFDAIEEPPARGPEAPPKKKFTIESLDEFTAGPPLTWIIKTVLPRAALGVIFGESGAGKSFVVLDMIAAIARGVDWRGCRTKQGRIVMVVAEGVSGARGRVAAYALHNGLRISDIPIGIISDVPNLLQADDKLIAKQVEEWGGADVIVIDTLLQSVAGANENSSEDMGKALAHCKRLHAATGALVLLVHHAGKDVGRGARGWSGIKGACDIELEVTRNGNQRAFKVSKSKDGRDGEAVSFRLNDVVLGQDEDGDDITSCVVEYTNEAVASINPKDKLTEKHHAVLGVLKEAELLAGPLHFSDLKRMTIDRLVPSGKTDNRPRDADKAIERLEQLGYIVKGEGSLYSTKSQK